MYLWKEIATFRSKNGVITIWKKTLYACCIFCILSLYDTTFPVSPCWIKIDSAKFWFENKPNERKLRCASWNQSVFTPFIRIKRLYSTYPIKVLFKITKLNYLSFLHENEFFKWKINLGLPPRGKRFSVLIFKGLLFEKHWNESTGGKKVKATGIYSYHSFVCQSIISLMY